jgi:hypothetical protein
MVYFFSFLLFICFSYLPNIDTDDAINSYTEFIYPSLFFRLIIKFNLFLFLVLIFLVYTDYLIFFMILLNLNVFYYIFDCIYEHSITFFVFFIDFIGPLNDL